MDKMNSFGKKSHESLWNAWIIQNPSNHNCIIYFSNRTSAGLYPSAIDNKLFRIDLLGSTGKVVVLSLSAFIVHP